MTTALTRLTLPLEGTIERRLLINYRLDPAIARTLIPPGLRPQLVDGSAVAGICLIRLTHLRPRWVPPSIGWRFENAAHRIAVEWDESDRPRSGVYIPERHSASWIPVAIGGRLFPGVHQHARIQAQDGPEHISVRLTAPRTAVAADVLITEDWSSSLFPTLEDASEFFQRGNVGWSPTRKAHALEGLQLQTHRWHVTAGVPLHVASSYFDALPRGAATLDNVLVMRDIPIQWTAPDTSACSKQRLRTQSGAERPVNVR
ncbi:UNVERIFIED_CONTAM: DUF2071 domain-containing protein [Microbacterium sp. SLM126]